MRYHFKIHKEGKFFWAQCIELEGCITQAHSLAKLHVNMQEALNLYIQEPEDSKDLASLPDDTIKKSKKIVEVAVDPQIALSFMVRYYRIQQGMTQQEAAKRMGFDNLYSYQRLEAKKCNPSLKTISRIKHVFPELSIDFALNA
jgi:antitoxin HicB